MKATTKAANQKPGGRALKQILDPRLVKALSHPLRADVLLTLSERVASPRELAEEVGLGVSDVSYHVRELKKCKCIELVGTKRRRGAIEHFYRATTRFLIEDHEWERLPNAMRPAITADLLRLVVKDLGGALHEGLFETGIQHMSRTPVMIDAQGWSRLLEVLDGALEQVMEIQAESNARIEEAGEEGFTATVAMLGFETAPSTAEEISRAA